MDPIYLSRVQFALTIMFHYLFPPLTIGLGAMLVILEGAWLKTGDPGYKSAAKFWTKIFALNFAMGVVTGIVMEFQFGTNWATYSRYVGDVFGSALAAEGIFAFFLESGFLAVLVFGWDRVSPRMHFFSRPDGRRWARSSPRSGSSWPTPGSRRRPATTSSSRSINGRTQIRAETTDFWAVVFNPSTMQRLVHVWIGAFILGAFFVMSITAYYILKKRHEDFARKIVHRRPGRGAGRLAGGPGLRATRRPRTSTAPSRPSWPPSRGTFRPAPTRPAVPVRHVPTSRRRQVRVRRGDSRAC